MEIASFIVAVAAFLVSGAAGIYAVVMKRSADSAAARSEAIARESNTIATDAKTLAAEANDMSRRTEVREIERHDVTWKFEQVTPGRYEIIKVGADVALSVSVEFQFDGELVRDEADRVEADGERLVLNVPRARQAYQRLRLERARQLREERASTFPMGSAMSVVYMTYHDEHLRVYWTTQAGTPKSFEDGGRFAGIFSEWITD